MCGSNILCPNGPAYTIDMVLYHQYFSAFVFPKLAPEFSIASSSYIEMHILNLMTLVTRPDSCAKAGPVTWPYLFDVSLLKELAQTNWTCTKKPACGVLVSVSVL